MVNTSCQIIIDKNRNEVYVCWYYKRNAYEEMLEYENASSVMGMLLQYYDRLKVIQSKNSGEMGLFIPMQQLLSILKMVKLLLIDLELKNTKLNLLFVNQTA